MRRDRSTARPAGRPPRSAPLACLLAGCAASLAAANVVVNDWTNGTHFHHKRSGVPDQDQIRVGLPNQGACYCAPTSFVNTMLYAATHGYPSIAFGDVDYSGYDHYYDITGLLAEVGPLAGISPGGDDPDDPDCTGDPGGDGTCIQLGCGGSMLNSMEAFRDLGYLGSAEDDLVFVARYLDPEAPTVSFTNLAKLGLDGHLVEFCYGRYSPVGATPQGETIYRRSGGHCVTMNEIERDGETRTLWSRDPNQDEDDPFGPSPWVSNEYSVTEPVVWVTTDPTGGPLLNWTPKQLPALNEPQADGKKRLVDGYLAVRPKTGVFWKNLVSIQTITLGVDFGPINPGPFATPSWPIVDLVDDDLGIGWIAIAGASGSGGPKLVKLDRVSGQVTTIGPTVATQLAMSRFNEFYALSQVPPLLQHFDADGTLLGTATIGGIPRAVVADDVKDRILVLVPGSSGFGGSVIGYGRAIGIDGQTPQTWTLPSSLAIGSVARLAVDPTNARLWIASASSDALTAFLLPPGGGVVTPVDSLAGFRDLRCVDFDDSGRMYVVEGGGVKVFEHDAAGGWLPGDASAFAGIDVGTTLRIAKSRTNFDPALHDREEWWNLVPSEIVPLGTPVPDCLGDLNGDHAVDAADLALLLGAWGAAGLADLDQSGEVDAGDIALMLGAWGACPN